MPSPFDRLPRVKSGEFVAARTTNAQSDAIEKLQVRAGAGVLSHQTPGGGTAFEPVHGNKSIWARIVSKGTVPGGSAPIYGWIELQSMPNGGWIDGQLSGTTASAISAGAFEVNGSTTVPTGTLGNTLTGGSTQSSGGAVVRLTHVVGCPCWTFQFGACPS